MTVTMARPMAVEGICGREHTEPAAAFAAMAAVPKVETKPCTSTLPTWNMPFSSPFGTPMLRILRIIDQFHWKMLSDCR